MTSRDGTQQFLEVAGTRITGGIVEAEIARGGGTLGGGSSPRISNSVSAGYDGRICISDKF